MSLIPTPETVTITVPVPFEDQDAVMVSQPLREADTIDHADDLTDGGVSIRLDPATD